MRQLFLTNEKNFVYDLTNINYGFLENPSGFGFSKSLEFANYTSIRNLISNTYNFGAISGNLIFLNYNKYNEFLDYLRNSNDLYLNYKPNTTINTYYIKVLISSIEKNEINTSKQTLDCTITFEATSYWQKQELHFSSNIVSEKPNLNPTYPLTYKHTKYATSIGQAQILSILLNNKGDLNAPLKIIIYGPAVNPSWKLGTQSGALNLTIQPDQELHIDSRENILSIYSGSTSLDYYKDHTKNNYIYAPKKESTLYIENATTVEVVLYEQYISI